VHEEVRSYFRPELLNRFDEQIVFGKLGRREVRTIAGLMMAETAARVKDKGCVDLGVGVGLGGQGWGWGLGVGLWLGLWV